MPNIYRQKRFGLLTKEQQDLKLKKDAEYEADSNNRATAFYTKKRTEGVTAQEEAEFMALDKQKWDEYEQWAISQGLYEEVTPEMQLTELELVLQEALGNANTVRGELGKRPLKLGEM